MVAYSRGEFIGDLLYERPSRNSHLCVNKLHSIMGNICLLSSNKAEYKMEMRATWVDLVKKYYLSGNSSTSPSLVMLLLHSSHQPSSPSIKTTSTIRPPHEGPSPPDPLPVTQNGKKDQE